MLIASYCTPSHSEMMNEFVTKRAAAAGFRGISLMYSPEQVCESGAFKRAGWNEATAAKYKYLAGLPEDGRPVLYVDADVAIYPGLAKWCEKHLDNRPPHWIGFGDDIVQWCTGVMLFRTTREVLDWFKFCWQFCDLIGENDQDGLHILRSHANHLPVECDALPGQRISNWATLGNLEPWQGQQIDVPETTLAWHANWCVGVQRKMEMLRHVTLATSDAE